MATLALNPGPGRTSTAPFPVEATSAVMGLHLG
jgi:hypothetical protein